MLCNVFLADHLELYDLLQMCNEGEHFRKIIAEKVMPHRVLNISEIHKSYSVRHAFKYLGQFAREVSIKQSDIQWKNEKFSVIEEILRLIGKRCAAGHLKKVSIVFDMNNVKSYNLNTEIPDCMKTIETLRIVQNCSRSENLDECVTGLLTGCSQLQSLILERFNSSGIFLSALHKMSQLRELTLDVFCLSKITCWQEFIQKPIPTLKSFCCSNMIIYGTGSFYEQALDQIMTAFPAIERLSCDNNVSFYSSDKLDALASMKSLHIKSSCIDGNVMKAIQKMTSLEELSIHIQYGNSYHCGGFIRQNGKQWLEALAGLKKLHSIKIQMGRQMAFSWDDVIEWLSELPSVTDICLIGFQSFRKKHIENIVSLSPELRCVKLGMPTTSLTRTLYQNLVNILVFIQIKNVIVKYLFVILFRSKIATAGFESHHSSTFICWMNNRYEN